VIVYAWALSLRTAEFPQERCRYTAAKGVPHGQWLLVTQVNTHQCCYIFHQAKEIVTPTYSAAYDMMHKKYMQNFGEEKCQSVPSSKMETDMEMLRRMELVQDHVQWWGFSIDSDGHSGQFIHSSVKYLFFQLVSQSVSQSVSSYFALFHRSVSENKTLSGNPREETTFVT
jgi:hypothetical protein